MLGSDRPAVTTAAPNRYLTRNEMQNFRGGELQPILQSVLQPVGDRTGKELEGERKPTGTVRRGIRAVGNALDTLCR